MTPRRPRFGIALAAVTLTLSGCITRPPTIAHVHIGHAWTGVHVTPGHKGYVPLAVQRANETLAAAEAATRAGNLGELKGAVAEAVAASDDAENFGLKQAVLLAANHITFAATSADASQNVMQFAPLFKDDTAGVIERCEYIDLLGKDVAASTSLEDASLVVRELVKAARANVQGDAPSGGAAGGPRPQLGVAQLRDELAAMIAREHPRYRTVDEWYLFNLVRLPNGRWVFDRLGRGGNIDGYK